MTSERAYKELREAVRQFLNESAHCPDSEMPTHPSLARVKRLAEVAGLKYECMEFRYKSPCAAMGDLVLPDCDGSFLRVAG